MKVNIEQAQRIVTEYFNKEILAKTTGLKKLTTGLLFNLYAFNMPNLLIQLANNPFIKATGVVDGSNFIDLDLLYTGAKDAMQKCGQVEFAGILFNDTDIDKLYNYAKNTII